MKGSIKVNDPVFIQFLPDLYDPKNKDAYRDKVFTFVCERHDTDQTWVTPRQIRECTGLGKTAVQRHLHVLVDEGMLAQRYGKFKYAGSTTITGCYAPTNKGFKLFRAGRTHT